MAFPVILIALLVMFLAHREVGTLKSAGRPFAIRSCEDAVGPINKRQYADPGADLESNYRSAVRNARVATLFVSDWKGLVDGSKVLQEHLGEPNPDFNSQETDDYIELLKVCIEVGRPLIPA